MNQEHIRIHKRQKHLHLKCPPYIINTILTSKTQDADQMKKHKSSERNTPLALTIGLLLIISVFAMSSCAKHKSEESDVSLTDTSSVTTSETSETAVTSSLTDGSSETSGEVTDTSASTTKSSLPTETDIRSADYIPTDSTPASGAETTPGAGSTDNPSTDPTKAPTKAPKATATPKPKATATPKPKATATPAPKATATPAPKENTPTPKPKPSGDASSSGAETLLNLINEKRAEAGVAPLTLNDSMNKAARIRAGELAQKYCHYRPPLFDEDKSKENKGTRALLDVGLTYSAAAENIATGQGSVSQVFSDWINSSGHKDNMLSSKYSKMGLGYIKANGTTYWCLLLMN